MSAGTLWPYKPSRDSLTGNLKCYNRVVLIGCQCMHMVAWVACHPQQLMSFIHHTICPSSCLYQAAQLCMLAQCLMSLHACSELRVSIDCMVYMQVSLLRQGRASGRLVVLVQALTTPTLVAAAAADSQPAGSFVQGTDVPAVIQVCMCSRTSHTATSTILLQCRNKAVSLWCLVE